MDKICFELETVTPLFMAGADGKTFELRPPSIKGALRFWWRAQYWGKESRKITPKDMEVIEGAMFGTTSNNGRKSRFRVRIKKQRLFPDTKRFEFHPITVKTSRKTFQMNILDYLAYGMFDFNEKRIFNRQYLPADSRFTLSLAILQENIQIDEKLINLREEILKSFYLLSAFGGLGAKSRNGFGGFTVIKAEPEDIFTEYKRYAPFPTQDLMAELIRNPETPPFTALSNKSKIFKLKQTYQTWHDCLAALGIVYREARGRTFESKHHIEKRQYIGAPIAVDRKQSFLERHAKLYFMKVIQQGESQFDGYIIYLPSLYCGGEKYGLKKDRFDNMINHNEVEKKSRVYCEEFNSLLADQMEVLL